MRALITGITGMDGSHLAEHLAATNHQVIGLIRHADHPKRAWLEQMVPNIQFVYADLGDPLAVQAAVGKADPDWLFHLAAVSSPTQAWEQPLLCGDITGLGTARVLEAALRCAPQASVVCAGSVATHGPYGAAKTYSRAIAADYRNRGLDVSTAVMVGHHSPRRGPSYLSKKVAIHAGRVAAGMADNQLVLGWLGRVQDWGWAPEFMQALPELAYDADADDYILGVGDPHSVEEYVVACYARVGLDWREWVTLDPDAGHRVDVDRFVEQPDQRLRWRATMPFTDLVNRMVDHEHAQARGAIHEEAIAWTN